ncbi:MAG: NAD(P)/FAD-dependent oxidoreductase [Candidatus Amulumruptor caecigallinarius]|nr:NAD(P)/FAD-dependent oxidoreductase [Candidatus Amulumruptor caecigallinarius]
MIQDITLKISPERAADKSSLLKEVAKAARLKADEINDMNVVRRSIDARKHPIVLNLVVRIASGDSTEVKARFLPIDFKKVPDNAPRFIIVGAGPAGLFAALKALQFGVKPIVVERGRDVDARRVDIANISREKKTNPRSNYCFGEGGAGAYSDGKLYTRSKKRGSVEEVLQLFVQHGASPNILVDAHPHIGSDKLPGVIKEIRNTILRCGGEVMFDTLVTALHKDVDGVKGVVTDKGLILADGVLIATGHSARDTFHLLNESGVALEPKGIAVGVRLEHPQKLIDKIQYHSPQGRGKYLPPAEYSFVTQVDERGVYSFCMCPGGVVVPAATADEELVVNGMSASARSGSWANSGMVVEIRPGDFPQFNNEGALQMLALQKHLETEVWHAAGNSIVAPAQRMKDFTEKKMSRFLPSSSYAPGIQSADFNTILPEFIAERLRRGFLEFGKKAPGFLTNEAILIGLESRTSSPVRITRDSSTLESVNCRRLYPAGEGAGYAGGIVSAAIDGIRCAEAFAHNYANDISSN